MSSKDATFKNGETKTLVAASGLAGVGGFNISVTRLAGNLIHLSFPVPVCTQTTGSPQAVIYWGVTGLPRVKDGQILTQLCPIIRGASTRSVGALYVGTEDQEISFVADAADTTQTFASGASAKLGGINQFYNVEVTYKTD